MLIINGQRRFMLREIKFLIDIRSCDPFMSAITKSARGQDCTLKIPGGCCGDSSTTVWAHSNEARHGKGLGIKAHDHFGAYACWKCHAIYDRQMSRPAGVTARMVELMFFAGMQLSQAKLVSLGVWDGQNIPTRAQKRPAKSRKIKVNGFTPLQRAALRKSA